MPLRFAVLRRALITPSSAQKISPSKSSSANCSPRRSRANSNLKVERRFYLAGSYICHQALVSGRIDAYVEYTGTALTAILKQPVDRNPESVLDTVRTALCRRAITSRSPSRWDLKTRLPW